MTLRSPTSYAAQDPAIEIAWLAGDPARRLLAEGGETLVPQSAAFAEETGSAEAAADGFSLNIVTFASRAARDAWERAVVRSKKPAPRIPTTLIVQGGGTTTLELTALRRPFLYLPLENHFEQNLVVGERVARHRAGRRMRYRHPS